MKRLETVLEFLQLLASKERQLEYEDRDPRQDAASELVRRCADELRTIDEEGVEGLSPHGMAIWKRFLLLVEERIAHLPPSQGTIRTWHSEAGWRKVMRQAGVMRGKLVDPDVSQHGESDENEPMIGLIRSRRRGRHRKAIHWQPPPPKRAGVLSLAVGGAFFLLVGLLAIVKPSVVVSPGGSGPTGTQMIPSWAMGSDCSWGFGVWFLAIAAFLFVTAFRLARD